MKRNIIALIIFLLTKFIYLNTIPPDITIEDSPQFVLTSYCLGISQPTGYPLFNILGKLSGYLPVSDFSFRINFFSAFTSSLSVVFFFFICIQIFNSIYISFITSLILAFSYFFWLNTVIIKIYSLHYLFVILLFYLHLIIKSDVRLLYLFTFIFGISLTNHFTTLFLLPLFLYHLRNVGIKKNFFITSVIFLIGFSIYIFLPIRAQDNPYLNWGNPSNFERFIFTITKSGWLEAFTGLPNFEKLKIKFQVSIYYIFINLSIYLSVIWIAGLIVSYFGKNKFYKFFLITFLIFFFGLPLIADPPKDAILRGDFLMIPIFLITCIWAGFGISLILKYIKIRYLKIIILIIPIFLLTLHYKEFDKSKEYIVLNYGYKMVSNLKQNSILFTVNVQPSFIGWYIQCVKNIRKDLTIIPQDFLVHRWYLKNLRRKGLNIPDSILMETSDSYFHFHGGEKVKRITDKIIKENIKRFPIYINYDGGDRTIDRTKFPNMLKLFYPKESPKILEIKR